MANKYRYTAQEVAEALKKAYGIKTIAAQFLGCDDETISNYCKRYAMVERARKEAKPRIVDIAETNLIKDLTIKENCPKCGWILVCKNCNSTITFGKDWATKFVLQTLGKERGYTERTEITGKDGGAITYHEEWETKLTEIKTFILDALEPFPEARKALLAALKEEAHKNGNSVGE